MALERCGHAKSRLERHKKKWRRTLVALIQPDGQTEDCVLMVEPVHTKLNDIVKLQRDERMVTTNKVAATVDLSRQFPDMNHCCGDGENVCVRIGVDLTTPQLHIGHLCVVEGRPVTKNAGQFLPPDNQRVRVCYYKVCLIVGDQHIAVGPTALAT